MNISVDVNGSLPAGLVDMYRLVEVSARDLAIPFLVVGAMARDLVLHHGFGANIERGTRDVDFAIQVDSWSSFTALRNALINRGMKNDERLIYRLGFKSTDGLPWELDILPFGAVTDAAQDLSWPPDGDIKMSMLGFLEALETAWLVNIHKDNSCVIPVANPVAMVILKMVAWTERAQLLRRKDASDVAYIIKSYEKIPAVFARLYDEGFAEACDFDLEEASAMLIGTQMFEVASEQTRNYLCSELLNDKERRMAFIHDMDEDRAESWIDRLSIAFQ